MLSIEDYPLYPYPLYSRLYTVDYIESNVGGPVKMRNPLPATMGIQLQLRCPVERGRPQVQRPRGNDEHVAEDRIRVTGEEQAGAARSAEDAGEAASGVRLGVTVCIQGILSSEDGHLLRSGVNGGDRGTR